MTPDPRIYGVPSLRWRWAKMVHWWGRPIYSEPRAGHFEPEGWEWLPEGKARRPLWPFALVLLGCFALWAVSVWVLIRYI